MLHKDPKTKILNAQETIDHINQQIKKYQDQKNFSDITSSTPQKVNLTKEEMIKSFRLYCYEIKENLKRLTENENVKDENSNEEISDNMSIENQSQSQWLAGEAQPNDEEIPNAELPIDCMIDMIEESTTQRKNLFKNKRTSSQ